MSETLEGTDALPAGRWLHRTSYVLAALAVLAIIAAGVLMRERLAVHYHARLYRARRVSDRESFRIVANWLVARKADRATCLRLLGPPLREKDGRLYYVSGHPLGNRMWQGADERIVIEGGIVSRWNTAPGRD